MAAERDEVGVACRDNGPGALPVKSASSDQGAAEFLPQLLRMYADGCPLHLADVLNTVRPTSAATSTLSMRHLDRETGRRPP